MKILFRLRFWIWSLVFACLMLAPFLAFAQAVATVAATADPLPFGWSAGTWALLNKLGDLLLFVLVPMGGLSYIGNWLVSKGIIQRRWEAGGEAAAGAALAAGRAAGPLGSQVFWQAASHAGLAYAKSQFPDVLAAKNMSDADTQQAISARVVKLIPAPVVSTAAAAQIAVDAMTTAAVPIPSPAAGGGATS